MRGIDKMQEDLIELLIENGKSEDIFYSVTDYVMEKEIENSFEDLDDVEKKAYIVGKYIMEVNNGGYDQYFFNTDGEYAKATVEFLDQIGERNFSKLLDESISIFKAVIPDDRKEEEFELMDQKFYHVDIEAYEELYDKFEAFLQNNIKENK